MSKKTTTISPRRLLVMWGEYNKINLIDLPGADEYRIGHVAGTRLIPLQELGAETLVTDELWRSAI